MKGFDENDLPDLDSDTDEEEASCAPKKHVHSETLTRAESSGLASHGMHIISNILKTDKVEDDSDEPLAFLSSDSGNTKISMRYSSNQQPLIEEIEDSQDMPGLISTEGVHSSISNDEDG
jgi:hypothetical protein